MARTAGTTTSAGRPGSPPGGRSASAVTRARTTAVTAMSPITASGTPVVGRIAASRCESVYQKPVNSRRVSPDTPAASTYRLKATRWLTTSQRRSRCTNVVTAPTSTSAPSTQPAPQPLVAPVSASPMACDGDSNGGLAAPMGPSNSPDRATTSQYTGAARTNGAASSAASHHCPAWYRRLTVLPRTRAAGGTASAP